jgi:hypothetical protein
MAAVAGGTMERPQGGAAIQSGFGKIFSVAEIRRDGVLIASSIQWIRPMRG